MDDGNGETSLRAQDLSIGEEVWRGVDNMRELADGFGKYECEAIVNLPNELLIKIDIYEEKLPASFNRIRGNDRMDRFLLIMTRIERTNFLQIY